MDLRLLIVDAAASARAATAAGVLAELTGVGFAQADPNMLRLVLLNLLLDAYQAGRDRPVEVNVATGDGACTITVLDRGPGIRRRRARVFEPALHTTKPEARVSGCRSSDACGPCREVCCASMIVRAAVRGGDYALRTPGERSRPVLVVIPRP